MAGASRSKAPLAAARSSPSGYPPPSPDPIVRHGVYWRAGTGFHPVPIDAATSTSLLQAGVLLSQDAKKASAVFLLEPRINEMEIVLDDHAIRMLREGNMEQEEIRRVVATLKINNDLERMANLAVNVGQRVIALSQMAPVDPPSELEPMSVCVRSMVGRSLGALIYRNLTLAHEVLESEEAVDTFRTLPVQRGVVTEYSCFSDGAFTPSSHTGLTL